MKKSIIFFLIGLLMVKLVSSQTMIHYSKIEKTKVEGQTTYLLKGEKTECTLYQNYPNGNFKIKFNVKDGLRNGVSEKYYENGQVKRKGKYKDGKKEGHFKGYYENGKLYVKSTFKSGKKEGYV